MPLSTNKLLQGEMKLKTIMSIAYNKARVKSIRAHKRISDSVSKLLQG